MEVTWIVAQGGMILVVAASSTIPYESQISIATRRWEARSNSFECLSTSPVVHDLLSDSTRYHTMQSDNLFGYGNRPRGSGMIRIDSPSLSTISVNTLQTLVSVI